MSTEGCDSTDDEATGKIYINNFDADRNGITNDSGPVTDSSINSCKDSFPTNDNLFMLCKCWYGITADINNACKTQVCHCSTG